MVEATIGELTDFLDQFGFILDDDQLNNGLGLYLEKSEEPKRVLFIKFFRRLDALRLAWLADNLTTFLLSMDYITTLEDTADLLHILRSMSPLYHMTHKSNITNILEHGLVSHNRAHRAKLVRSDISLSEAQARRGHLHDHVPLYFNPRNTMLYRRKNIESEIVMIAINPLILFTCSMITNGNGASPYSTLYTTTEAHHLKRALESLEWDIIMAEKWYDEDEQVMNKQRRIMCAEALVPSQVPVIMIEYIGYSCKASLDEIQEYSAKHKIMCLKSHNLYLDTYTQTLSDLFSTRRSRSSRRYL